METITYNLRRPESDFYRDLRDFTDEVLSETDEMMPVAEEFISFIGAERIESIRSREEYLMELLTIGVYWNNYAGTACSISNIILWAFSGLVCLRKRYSAVKPFVDPLRGFAATRILAPGKVKPPPAGIGNFTRLVRWLEATGDFQEEAIRLQHWLRFFKLQNRADVRRIIDEAAFFAIRFTEIAEVALGGYVPNAGAFHQKVKQDRKNREDSILRCRPVSDYFLIMVGAEILNRSLRNAFAGTHRKIVLLPGCMRRHNGPGCRSEEAVGGLKCVHCSVKCAVSRVQKLGDETGGFDVRIIIHASEFTRQLEVWKGRSGIGLIASACVLHLFQGGYEMKKLGIPSQCVFLDYCGCRKHWHDKGIPTDINDAQLLEVADSQTGRKSLMKAGPDKNNPA